MPTMDVHPAPNTACGYASVESGLLSTAWHLDPTCPELDPNKNRTATAASLLELAWAQCDRGLTPCPTCLYDVLLDDVAAHGAEPGHHFLVCDGWHTPAGCDQCTSLAAYAARRGAPVATIGGRVAILRAGAVRLPTHCLSMLRVDVHSTHGERPPAITAPMWVAAAALIARGAQLATALTCAAALYDPPGAGLVPLHTAPGSAP